MDGPTQAEPSLHAYSPSEPELSPIPLPNTPTTNTNESSAVGTAATGRTLLINPLSKFPDTETSRHKLMYVKAKVQGRIPIVFLTDSGSSINCLSEKSWEEIRHLVPKHDRFKAEHSIVLANSDTMNVKLRALLKVRTGHVVSTQLFSVVPTEMNVIGVPFLRANAMTIDFSDPTPRLIQR